MKKRGEEHGCLIVVDRSRNGAVDLRCSRGGEYKSTATVRRTGSAKTNCPFKLLGRFDRGSDSWKLKVENQTHNHGPIVFKEGHPYLRRLTDEQKDVVARLHRQGLRPVQILDGLRDEFPEILCVLKDINNHVRAIKDKEKVGKTPMDAFENFLDKNGFLFQTLEKGKNKKTKLVFFIHSTSYKMWRAFPHILLIDATYKTNMYGWPFLQFVGMTSTLKSFCIAHAFLCREREADFTWALEQVKKVIYDCIEPRVIVTDRDLALMKACDRVFPNATKNLCRWHIQQNIAKKWKSLFKGDVWDNFNYSWTKLCSSPTIDDYTYQCGKMEEYLTSIERQSNFLIYMLLLIIIGRVYVIIIGRLSVSGVWYYMRDNWLNPYKEKFVTCWSYDRLNFGQHTTNRVESQHADIKRYLHGSNNSFETIAGYVLKVVRKQEVEIGKSFEVSRIKIMKHHNLKLFKYLLRHISIEALHILEAEHTKSDKMIESGSSCGHQLLTSMGLTCACRIEQHNRTVTPIPLISIDPFWRKLDFEPESIEAAQPDIEKGLNEINEKVRSEKDPVKKLSMYNKLKSAIFGNKSTKSEPEKRQDPRGRPSQKKQQKQPPVSEPARHSSYTSSQTSSQKDPGMSRSKPEPARHSSYTSTKTRKGDSKAEHKTASYPKFPLMKKLEDGAKIYKFEAYIPEWSYPYISDMTDVRPDGNCGFRAVAVALGMDSNRWPDIRKRMVDEMDNHFNWWFQRFEYQVIREGYTMEVRNKLEWFNTCEFAPPERWLSLPNHGFVIAQTFQCIVIQLGKMGSQTFFPMRETPEPLFEYPIVTLVNISNQHWITVKMSGNFPIPPPAYLMASSFATPEAKEWAILYDERLNEYNRIAEQWRQPAPFIDLEGLNNFF